MATVTLLLQQLETKLDFYTLKLQETLATEWCIMGEKNGPYARKLQYEANLSAALSSTPLQRFLSENGACHSYTDDHQPNALVDLIRSPQKVLVLSGNPDSSTYLYRYPAGPRETAGLLTQDGGGSALAITPVAGDRALAKIQDIDICAGDFTPVSVVESAWCVPVTFCILGLIVGCCSLLSRTVMEGVRWDAGLEYTSKALACGIG